MSDFQNIMGVVFTGIASITVTSAISHFSKKGSRNKKKAETIVNIYSPIVQFLTSLEFLETNIADTIAFLEKKLYIQYDYVCPTIIRNLSKIKYQKQQQDNPYTYDFFNLYYLIQIKYHRAKNILGNENDSRFVDSDHNIFSSYLRPIVVFFIIFYLFLLIYGKINDIFLDKAFAYIISLFTIAFIFCAFIVALFVIIQIKIIKKALQKEWATIVSDAITKENAS